MFWKDHLLSLCGIGSATAGAFVLSICAGTNTPALVTTVTSSVAFRARGVVPLTMTNATLAVAATLSATLSTVAKVFVDGVIIPATSYKVTATASGSLALTFRNTATLHPGSKVVVTGTTKDQTAVTAATLSNSFQTTLRFIGSATSVLAQ